MSRSPRFGKRGSFGSSETRTSALALGVRFLLFAASAARLTGFFATRRFGLARVVFFVPFFAVRFVVMGVGVAKSVRNFDLTLNEKRQTFVSEDFWTDRPTAL